jgi:hypothetical protein
MNGDQSIPRLLTQKFTALHSEVKLQQPDFFSKWNESGKRAAKTTLTNVSAEGC